MDIDFPIDVGSLIGNGTPKGIKRLLVLAPPLASVGVGSQVDASRSISI